MVVITLPKYPRSGFTIIELLVVMAIVALLASVVTPKFIRHLDVSKETVLRQNLYVTRDAIDKYYADTGKYPASLQALVDSKYLRRIPEDPIASRANDWILVAPIGGSSAIYDLRSGAAGASTDGSLYATW